MNRIKFNINKKIISIFVALLLVFTVIPCEAWADETITNGNNGETENIDKPANPGNTTNTQEPCVHDNYLVEYSLSGATCTEKAKQTPCCSNCKEPVGEPIEVEDAPALGHDLKVTSYSWSPDQTSCTAKGECDRKGCGFVDEATTTNITKANGYLTAEFSEAWAGKNTVEDKQPASSSSSSSSTSSSTPSAPGSTDPSPGSESEGEDSSGSSSTSSSGSSKPQSSAQNSSAGTGTGTGDVEAPDMPEGEENEDGTGTESEVPEKNDDDKIKKSFFEDLSPVKIAIAAVAVAAVLGGVALIFFRTKKKKAVVAVHKSSEILEIIPMGPVVGPKGEVWVNSSSIIGTRSYQQDFVLTPDMVGIPQDIIESKGCFCVLCDGMGGLDDGGTASRICAETMMKAFYESTGSDVAKIIYKSVCAADEMVHCLKNSEGKPMKAGTTMTSILVKNGKLIHSNVGDSRIYLYRGGRIIQLSKDHNYFEDLVAGHPEGSPEWKAAFSNKKKDALTSYVGMGGIAHFDICKEPVELMRNDVIFMCTDGLYRSVTEREMASEIARYIDHIEFLPHVMTATAFDAGKQHQDNTSVITVKYMGNPGREVK